MWAQNSKNSSDYVMEQAHYSLFAYSTSQSVFYDESNVKELEKCSLH